MYSKKSIFLAITIIVINIPFVFARGFDFRKLNQIESGVKIGEKVLNSSRKDNSNRQKKVKSAEDKIIEEITKNNNPSMVNIGKYYDENPNLNFELIEQGINGHSLNINQRKIFDRIKLLSEVNDEFVWIYVVLSKNVRDILGSGTEVNKIHPKYGTALDMALKIKAEDSVIADSNVVALRKAGGKTSAELKAEEEKKRRIEEERLRKEEEERIRREEAEKQAQIAKAKEEAERKRRQEAEKQVQIAKAKKEAEQKRKIAEQKKKAEEEKRKAKELQLAELSKSNTNSQKEIDSQVLSVINTFKANMKNDSKPSEISSANDKQNVVTIVKISNEDNTKCEDKEDRLRREEAEKKAQIDKAKEKERKLKQEAKRPPVKIENPSSKEDKIINLIITSKDSDDITSFLLRYDYPNFKFEPIKKYFETCILDEKIQRNYDLIKIYCGLSEPFLQAIFLGDLINWLPKYGRVDIEKFNEIRTIPGISFKTLNGKHNFESFTTLDFAFATLFNNERTLYLNEKYNEAPLDEIISYLIRIGVKTTLNITLSKYEVLRGIKGKYLVYFSVEGDTKYLFTLTDLFTFDFKINELEEECEKEFLDSSQKESLNLIKKYYVLKTEYPLILAAFCGNVARVKELIKTGEDVNKVSDYGTALDEACNNNIKEILQKAGAKLSSQLKEKTNKTKIKSGKQPFNEFENAMLERLNALSNLNYELDGFKLGSKLEVTSDMKKGNNEFVVEKGDYTISIATVNDEYIRIIVKEYVCDSLREAKKKMVSETDKIEKKYNLGRQDMQTKFVNGHIQYIMNYAPFDTYVTIDEDNLRNLYYVRVSLFDALLEGYAQMYSFGELFKGLEELEHGGRR